MATDGEAMKTIDRSGLADAIETSLQRASLPSPVPIKHTRSLIADALTALVWLFVGLLFVVGLFVWSLQP